MTDIKEKLQALITENASKELIEQVAVISQDIDNIIAEGSKTKEQYTELLKDYASLVKHSVYNVDNKTLVDEGKKDFSFESFAEKWEADRK